MVTVSSALLRVSWAGIRSPGLWTARTVCSAATEGTGWSARAVMMSPGWIPASAAGPPGVTLITPIPVGWPLVSATVCAVMPRDGRQTALNPYGTLEGRGDLLAERRDLNIGYNYDRSLY